MKKLIMLVAIIIITAQGGCQRGPQNTVTGDAGEVLTVTVPDSITLNQGSQNKFSVTVTRKNIKDTVKVKLENLPKGVSLADGDFTFADGTDSQFVTLEAKPDAEPQKDAAIIVTANAGKFSVAKKLRVNVQQSLDNKAAAKKAFAASIDNQLAKVKSQLEFAEKLVKTSEDENKRSNYLEQIARRYESLADARGDYEKLLATAVEDWEREKDVVTQSVAAVEKSTQSLIAELKTLEKNP